MDREWYYLDALHQQHGPISGAEIVRVTTDFDCLVWTEGLPEWIRSSELYRRPTIDPRVPVAPSLLNEHAQPVNRRWNARRRLDRDLHELLGLVRGVIADGHVSDSEATALARWLDLNAEAAALWPASVVGERLRRIFQDGCIDEEERADLKLMLERTVGEEASPLPTMNRATRLPLDDPPPKLAFAGRQYVFTGQFAYGTRRTCEQAVVDLGGKCSSSITKRTHVVVVGTLGSEDWVHSSFGRKIEKAVTYRAAGIPLSIVSEEHWTTHVR